MSLEKSKLAEVLLAPVVTEKAMLAADKNKKFVFKVQKSANKLQIKKAVELMFDVEVESVNVLNAQGKIKRFGRTLGKRSDWKKAYVTLREGQDINFASA